MNRFAELLDRLTYEQSRNNKLRLMTDYFRSTADPERGWALAALTGVLSFPHAKPGLIRSLIAERTDPVLFELSYDYVGDLSETVALMWPAPARLPPPCGGGSGRGVGRRSSTSTMVRHPIPGPSPQACDRARDKRGPVEGGEEKNREKLTLSVIIETLSTLGKTELPRQLARWLDALDETGRWALIKLVTGGLRVGVSARLAKAAVAALGATDAHDIELLWPGLAPPYIELFAWLEGRAEKPASADPAPFRPPMLAHALEDTDLAALDPAEFMAEWKWDGIRVQAAAARRDGAIIARLYSRTGEDISKSFPDLVDALRLPGAIDGELLIMRDSRVQSFNVLQQRLNRKTVTDKLMAEFPAHLRAYDLLADGEEDLRQLPFAERRRRLEEFITRLGEPRIDLSPLVSFATWDDLMAARKDPAAAGAGIDAEAVEGRHAQAARCALRARPPERPVVEMEARPPHHRRRADVCPARPRQALVVLFRLHVRGLDAGRRRRRIGAGRQGVFRLHRRGAIADRPLRPPQHDGPVWSGARGRARAGSGPRA